MRRSIRPMRAMSPPFGGDNCAVHRWESGCQTATGFQAATVPRQPGSSSSAVARVSSADAPAASSWSGGYLADLPLAFQLHQERGESVAEPFDA